MSQPYFDTLKYAKFLISSGFNPTQVQGLMSAQIEVLQATLDKLATHSDLQKLDAKIHLVEQRLEAKISEVKTFTLKNTLFTILTVLSLNIDYAAFFALFK